ncbi:glycoside hydrolase family 5 protein, partial [Streptomyces sp. McG3]|nr:glycoside hydrolase family 5 protein [Streptomyces sp. McG3]
MHQRTTPPTGTAVTAGRRRMARKALLAASALGVVTALMAPVRAGAAPA